MTGIPSNILLWYFQCKATHFQKSLLKISMYLLRLFYKCIEGKWLINSKTLLLVLSENQVKNVENVSDYILYVGK